MQLILLLFISGNTSQAQALIDDLQQENHLATGVEIQLSVVDVLTDPEKANDYDVFSTPTLLRIEPKPSIKILGRFDSTPKIINLLRNIEIQNSDEIYVI